MRAPSPERTSSPASAETMGEKRTRITDIALEALQLRESSGDSLFRSQDKRYKLYDNAVCDTERLSDVTQADPGLRASVMLTAEILFLSSRPASEQDEAANQIKLSVDKYLTEHPDWVAKTGDEKNARKTELLSGFAEAAEEYNTENATRRSRTRAAATSGFVAVKGAFQNGKARAKNRFSGPEESEEPVSLESLSDEEFTASYDKARKKYAKVVHQDTTRAFLKLRIPGKAKKTKEEFYALQNEFFRRNNKNETVAGSDRTVAQVDYIANLQALGEAQRKDKSPIYRSAKRFANSKLSAKIATGVATGFALKIAGGALAGVTAGASVGVALGLSRLRGINNARFKEDSDANYTRFADNFDKVSNDDFNETLEQNKQAETAELRARMVKAAATTAVFGAMGYGIGHLVSGSGFGNTLSDSAHSVTKKVGDAVDWTKNHTPLPNSKHIIGSTSKPSFGAKPSVGETLSEWKDRISGGNGIKDTSLNKAADTMFEIHHDPSKMTAFTNFLENVSTPQGQMDFARFDAMVQHGPKFDPIQFSNYINGSPKPSIETLEASKDLAKSAVASMGKNGPAVLGNLQGYSHFNHGGTPSSYIKEVLKNNRVSLSDFVKFMSEKPDTAKSALGTSWKSILKSL